MNCPPSCADWNQTVGPWRKIQPSPMSSAEGAKEYDPDEAADSVCTESSIPARQGRKEWAEEAQRVREGSLFCGVCEGVMAKESNCPPS